MEMSSGPTTWWTVNKTAKSNEHNQLSHWDFQSDLSHITCPFAKITAIMRASRTSNQLYSVLVRESVVRVFVKNMSFISHIECRLPAWQVANGHDCVQMYHLIRNSLQFCVMLIASFHSYCLLVSRVFGFKVVETHIIASTYTKRTIAALKHT